jgi:hypothetical protein
MSATAAVRGLFRIPRAGPDFLGIEGVEDDSRQWVWHARADNIRNILCQSGQNISRLSLATRERFGIGSSYFIPPTFLCKLRNGLTPHVCQVAALSESTGYRFLDWLRFFGFDLHQIPRLQMCLHTRLTVLVTPVESGRDFFLPQIYPGNENCPTPYSSRGSRYLFAKIGSQDAELYPRLSAGSIARVDRFYGEHFDSERFYGERFRSDDALTDGRLWLVELPGGLTCCKLQWIDRQQIVLLPNRAPWGCWPLRLPTEARVLGVVDTNGGALHITAQCRKERRTISELLRLSRRRTGLTFRSAHELTRTIARIVGNRDYEIALGMLSDYEVMGKVPRHIAKILSLCIVYCIDFWELMEAAGVYIDESAKLSLPAASQLHLSSQYVDDSMHHSRAVS